MLKCAFNVSVLILLFSVVIVSLQVFQTSSEKIESAGLAALTALTSCLSRSVLNSDSEDSLSTFLDVVLKGEMFI